MNFNGFSLIINEAATLTFNRPGVNIFSTPVLNEFIHALDLAASKGAKALLVTGSGNTFMAGADIKEMASFTPEKATAFARLFHRALGMVADLPLPVVAAVNGFALGGGCELVLACDLAIASDIAVFGQPELSLGILPGAGGTQRLRDRVGALKARELILTGRKVSATEALQIGLVNKVVPREKLMEEASALCNIIASKPAQCVRAVKRLINKGSLEQEIEEFSKLFEYEDQKALMNKFLKKD